MQGNEFQSEMKILQLRKPLPLLAPYHFPSDPEGNGMQGFLSEERRGAVLRNLRTDAGTMTRDYLSAAREVLQELVAMPDLIQRLPLERKAGCYSRNLLAGDENVSVWAIVWGEGSATSIHDHHCSCCFGVVSGTVTETWYRAIDASRAVQTEEQERQAGYVACMLPSGPNIHRMRNLGSGDAISIHVYGFDHEAHASSIETEYTAVSG